MGSRVWCLRDRTKFSLAEEIRLTGLGQIDMNNSGLQLSKLQHCLELALYIVYQLGNGAG